MEFEEESRDSTNEIALSGNVEDKGRRGGSREPDMLENLHGKALIWILMFASWDDVAGTGDARGNRADNDREQYKFGAELRRCRMTMSILTGSNDENGTHLGPSKWVHA